MGAPSPQFVDLWLARAFNAYDAEAGEAASIESTANALLLTAKSAGATFVEGAGAPSAKEASHA